MPHFGAPIIKRLGVVTSTPSVAAGTNGFAYPKTPEDYKACQSPIHNSPEVMFTKNSPRPSFDCHNSFRNLLLAEPICEKGV